MVEFFNTSSLRNGRKKSLKEFLNKKMRHSLEKQQKELEESLWDFSRNLWKSLEVSLEEFLNGISDILLGEIFEKIIERVTGFSVEFSKKYLWTVAYIMSLYKFPDKTLEKCIFFSDVIYIFSSQIMLIW